MKHMIILPFIFLVGCQKVDKTVPPSPDHEDHSPKIVSEISLQQNGCSFNGDSDKMSCEFKSNYIDRYNQYKAAINYALDEKAVDKSSLNAETKLGLLGRALAITNYTSFGVVENKDYYISLDSHYHDDAFDWRSSPIESAYNSMEMYLRDFAGLQGGVFVDFSTTPARVYTRGKVDVKQLQEFFELKRSNTIGHLDENDPKQAAVLEELEPIFDAIHDIIFEAAK